MSMRGRGLTLALSLAVFGTACWDRTEIAVALLEVGGSGVTGTAILKNALCKSNCALIEVELFGQGSVPPSVDLRKGRCGALGERVEQFQRYSADPARLEDQLATTRDIRTLVGSYSIGVWRDAEVDQDGTLLACGDI